MGPRDGSMHAKLLLPSQVDQTLSLRLRGRGFLCNEPTTLVFTQVNGFENLPLVELRECKRKSNFLDPNADHGCVFDCNCSASCDFVHIHIERFDWLNITEPYVRLNRVKLLEVQ